MPYAATTISLPDHHPCIVIACLGSDRSSRFTYLAPVEKGWNREKEAVMKKLLFQGLACVCFFSAAVVVVSRAQTVGLRADIPFSFNVDEKVLPPGNYLILAPEGQMLKILGPNGNAALAITNQVSGKPPAQPGAVVFNCYGER